MPFIFNLGIFVEVYAVAVVKMMIITIINHCLFGVLSVMVVELKGASVKMVKLSLYFMT